MIRLMFLKDMTINCWGVYLMMCRAEAESFGPDMDMATATAMAMVTATATESTANMENTVITEDMEAMRIAIITMRRIRRRKIRGLRS